MSLSVVYFSLQFKFKDANNNNNNEYKVVNNNGSNM